MSKKTEDTMFVFDTDATFEWPVVVPVPSSTNVGQKVKTKFFVEFKHVDQERRLEILREHREEMQRYKDAPEDEQIEGLFNLSQRVLEEVVVGFRGVVNRDRVQIPFSPEAKKGLITHQMVWPRIFKAYNEAIGTQDSRGN
jgi:hypothetical protein